MNVWIMAVRPWSLIASAAPVILATALAVADGTVHWPSLPLLLICAALIQISSNLINDLEDAKRGADAKRVGPLRAVSSGLISARSMRNVSLIVIVAAFVIGQPLVFRAGWEILLIGVACLIAAWAYTGGPFPLAYHGLGDAAAFLFFGLIAVVGTYYVHACVWSADSFIVALGPGFLAANIFAVNNIRDIPTDAEVGKRTFAVRIGSTSARRLYAAFMLAAVIVPSYVLSQDRGPWLWLPLVSLPYGLFLASMVLKRTGAELNKALAGTAMFYLLYTVLMSVALVADSYSVTSNQ
ncbi:MAG: 1,4-dihydroxy-2-naphthoate polyprenyltransferase [Ignavibacteria bacterium]|nr:1,4-dihydroxy-2-naphthoate polyprenyltransferase [Ignavibacteria bacterium]